MLPVVTGLVVHAPLRTRIATVQPRMVPQMSLVDDVKAAVLPTNTEQTLRNLFGFQALAWGVGSIVAPTKMMSTVFGATVTPASLSLIRGCGFINLLLGARMAAGTDTDAAADGFLFFGGWHYLIKNAAAAGTVAALSATVVTWNLLMTICAARRQGGLYKTVTSLDMGTLTSVLPKDRELTTQNIVGVQLFAWAVVCLFYPAILTGGLLLNTAVTPVISLVVSGLGLGNLLLGGRVMRGDAKSAASTGLVLFSGWTVLSALAKQAGVFTGTYFGLCTVVNALTAAYCLKELL